MDLVEEVTAEDLVAPERAVVLVVDVQNDFCDDRGVFGLAGLSLGAIQRAVDTFAGFVEAARRTAVPVVFVKTHHDRWNNSRSFLTRRIRETSRAEICATGTWGAEPYRVRPTDADCVVVKHRYSGFLGTSLEVVLRSLGRTTLLVGGVTTNVCVESTVRDGFMRDYDVVLVEDCAGAITKEEHDAAVHNVRTYFGRVMTSATVVSAWASQLASR